MSTGDLTNNVKRLQSELKSLKYPTPLDQLDLKQSKVMVNLLRYILLDFSPEISQAIVHDMGYELSGRTDERFIEGLYKFLIVELKYSPKVRKEQFLQNNQFLERKVLMLTDCIQLLKRRFKFYNFKPSCATITKSTISQPLQNVKNISCPPVAVKVVVSDNNKENSVEREPKPPAPPQSYIPSIEQRRRALLEFHKSLQTPLYPNRADFSSDSHSDCDDSAPVSDSHDRGVDVNECDDVKVDAFNDLFTRTSLHDASVDKRWQPVDEQVEVEEEEYADAEFPEEREMTLDEIQDVDIPNGDTHAKVDCDKYLAAPHDLLLEASSKIQSLADVMQRVLDRLDRSEEALSRLQ